MHKPAFSGALLTLGLALVGAPARAEPRTHDGFQFRGTLGAGFLSDTEEASGGNGKVTVSGISWPFEVYFGGSLAKGLSLGGTMNFAARRFRLHELWPEAVVVYPQGLATKTPRDPAGKRGRPNAARSAG